MFVENIQDYNSSFARISWIHVQEIQRAEDPTIKKQIFGNFNHLIRVWSGNRAKYVSKQALALFRERRPGLNPFDVRWEQRIVLGFHSPRKPKIVWEHSIPVGQFIKELAKCESLAEIEKKMDTYPGACWITREEDNLLNSSGYKNSRPGGFETCYAKCGIEVLSENEYKILSDSIHS
jgi:hypothetical protein